jgi:NitT/TauT family transport system substrate-binding protein
MKTTKLLVTLLAVLGAAIPARAEKTVVRIGHFPNITHVQALVAHNLSRQGKGWFEQRLGPDVEIQWFTYNAGPSAMEAVFANSIDATYVGPSPALNAYAKSKGAEIRIIAGSVNGGAALLVQPGSGLKEPVDFRGKKIATPQFGNTQDVAARAWLTDGGLKITQLGGDAQVLPTANPDQLSLFQQKQIDAVWTVEPWVSRIELEAGGKILLEQPDTITTVLVSSVKFLKERPELVKKITDAQRELTEWIKQSPDEAQKLVQAELTEITRKEIKMDLIKHAWPRIILTNDVSLDALKDWVKSAQQAGFLRDAPDLSQLVVKP